MVAKKRLLSTMAGLAMMAMPVSSLAANHHFWSQSAASHPQAAHAAQHAANRSLYAANQPGRYGWANNGNWIRNQYIGRNPPPAFRQPSVLPPSVYSYVRPFSQFW